MADPPVFSLSLNDLSRIFSSNDDMIYYAPVFNGGSGFMFMDVQKLFHIHEVRHQTFSSGDVVFGRCGAVFRYEFHEAYQRLRISILPKTWHMHWWISHRFGEKTLLAFLPTIKQVPL